MSTVSPDDPILQRAAFAAIKQPLLCHGCNEPMLGVYSYHHRKAHNCCGGETRFDARAELNERRLRRINPRKFASLQIANKGE